MRAGGRGAGAEGRPGPGRPGLRGQRGPPALSCPVRALPLGLAEPGAVCGLRERSLSPPPGLQPGAAGPRPGAPSASAVRV